MRSKGGVTDYRYFPDPGFVPLELSPSVVEDLRQACRNSRTPRRRVSCASTRSRLRRQRSGVGGTTRLRSSSSTSHAVADAKAGRELGDQRSLPAASNKETRTFRLSD